MKKISRIIMPAMAIFALSFVSCKKEGCIDSNAANYNEEAKKDDGSCTYPTITFSSVGAGLSGDVNGSGGSITSTYSWTNTSGTADCNMDFTAQAESSYVITVTDASGTNVWTGTLNDSSPDDTVSGASATGSTGVWTVTVSLTNFSGAGSFSITQ